MENNLQEGWIEIPFTELLDIQGGTQPPKNTFKYEPTKGYIRLLQIRDFGEKPHPTFIIDKPQLKTCEEDDILIARYGASIGRIVTGMTGAYNVALAKVVIPKPINKNFIKYLLKSEVFQKPILNIERSAQDGFNKDDLAEIEIPLPPLPEQNRIVAKLDAVIKKVESNKQRLENIPIILKRFRQSVLAAAVNGKLTEAWRAENGIDDEWEYMKATDACETVASGSTPKNNPFFEKEEIPYLKVYNIVNQKIDFFYKPQYIKRAIHEKELKRCKVYPNDVLINIVGPPLGKVALMPDTFPEWNINQAIVVFRPKEFLSPIFLYYILCDGKQIKNIELELRGTAGQQNISLTQCRNFDFPIPKPEEQKEIIRRVEQLFAFANKLEARYTKAKTMIDKLPQSILAKAFRGELVAQDPNDEPASVLLERIKKEKEKLEAEKKGARINNFSKKEKTIKADLEKKVKYKKAKA